MLRQSFKDCQDAVRTRPLREESTRDRTTHSHHPINLRLSSLFDTSELPCTPLNPFTVMEHSIETKSSTVRAMDQPMDTKSSNEMPPSVDGHQPGSEKRGDVVELAATFTPEEEKRVLRKIDCTILPMVCLWNSRSYWGCH